MDIFRPSHTFGIFMQKLTALHETPKKLAQSVALGLAIDFLPIPIISIPLSYLVARLTRHNPVATVATVIFFKLAIPVFYALNYMMGKVFLADMSGPEMVNTGIVPLDAILDKIFLHGYPFLIGCLINAVLAWFVAYYLLLFILERRQCNQKTDKTIPPQRIIKS
ncbi:MAG: DUF2062 domain-containing protein [Bacillota bacterium]